MELEPGWYLFGPRNQNMKSIRLKDGVTVLGRGDANDVQILEVEISRNHCRFEVNAKSLTITDLKSCNGSYVKDAQIKPSLPVGLMSGDSIGFGISPTSTIVSNLVFKAVYKPSLSYDFPELTEEERFWLLGKRKCDEDASSSAKKPKVNDESPMSPEVNKSDSDDDVIFVCRREFSHFRRPSPPKSSEKFNFSQDEGAIVLIDSDEESQMSEKFVSPCSKVNLNVKIKEEPEANDSEEEPIGLIQTVKPIETKKPAEKPIFRPEAESKVKKISTIKKKISQGEKKKLLESRREKLKEIALKTKRDEDGPKEKKIRTIKMPNISSRSDFLSKLVEKKVPPRKAIEIPIEDVHHVRPQRNQVTKAKKDEKCDVQENKNAVKLKENPKKIPVKQLTHPKVILYNWNNLLKTSSRVFDICSWNTSWLEEAKAVKGNPPLSRMPPVKVENAFINFEHYKNCMQSLLLSEFFRQAVEERYMQQCKAKTYSPFYGIIENSYEKVVHNERKLKICECTIVCKKNVEKENLMMKLADVMETMVVWGDQTKRTHKSFCVVGDFISSRKLKPINFGNEYVKILVNELKKKKIDVCYWFRAVLIFKSSPSKELNNNSRLTIRPSTNAILLIKMNEAIEKVSSSALMKVILDPTQFLSAPSSNKKRLVTNLPLNIEQTKAVLSCSESIWSNKPSISMIHGPPGTGKTHVITSLILQILHHIKKNKKCSKPDKILICAQTNAAIDEIVLRLLQVCEGLSADYKIVRCGNSEMMHKDVCKINPAVLAKRRFLGSEGSINCQTYLSNLQEQENILKMSCFDQSKSEEMKQKNKEDLSKMQIRIKNLEDLTERNILDSQMLNEEERKIIYNADVIATTLSSCFNHSICTALYERDQRSVFSCCIIDEATQAIEPEILLPILHNIENFVLVGDPLQLPPTIQSKVSKDLDFDKSLYHRIWSVWNGKHEAPLYKLNVQYRMHPEIISFPSNCFYKNSISTPSILETKESFKHYSVIEHNFQQNKKMEFNKDEALLVINLLKLINSSDLFKNMSVGIISPYVQHKNIIQKMILGKDMPNLMLDTIDSFQGKEKDIVIFSCVRTEGMGFLFDQKRVNVALTRARKCLIIIGNFCSLGKDPTWKALLDDAKARHSFYKLNTSDAGPGSLEVFDFVTKLNI